MADYSKQKSATGVKGAPRHKEHNAPGGPKNPFRARNDKAALVAKLSETARKAKEEK